MKKTYSAKKGDLERRWYVVDLDGAVLGRAASTIATLLRGKHKARYTPHVDTGDFVVAINADKVRLTGRKLTQKKYHRHSGYIGNLRSMTAAEMMEKTPERLVRAAVKGMLPSNILARAQLKKLKIYAGSKHPHDAQQPKPLDLKDIQGGLGTESKTQPK
jgi:large subunit ribosomal protein L13